MKYLILMLVSFTLIGLIGCHTTVHHGSQPVHHDTVVIKPAHSCNHHDACGHVWDGGVWVNVHNHRHGPGCGHVHSNGRWAVGVSTGGGNTKVRVHTPGVDIKVKKH